MANVDRRTTDRKKTRQEVRCLTSLGPLPEIWLYDLSLSGCQVVMQNGRLTDGQVLTIRPEGIESLAATVRWVEGDRAGIEFAFPLYPSVFDRLLKSKIDPDDVRRLESHELTDRFGRLMAPLPSLTIARRVS